MNKTTQVVWIITTILLIVVGLWPLGLIILTIGVFINKNPLPNKRKTETKNQKICEFEIYKQAAEIEKHLKEDKP